MSPQSPALHRMSRLLELLAADAPAAHFEALLHDARTAGAPDPDLSGLQHAVDNALRVHHVLRRHRRREAELTALFDTAGDLAALRDADSVLQSIVRRARMLLGTHTAYLTLSDKEAGDTYVAVTDGSVSPLFQNLRVGLGDGIGGLVAQTARPYATPDYRTDRLFRHTRTIDTGVTHEGLAAILGVPLLLGSRSTEGGTVIGVLFAADRTPRTFSPDEVALLCSLAAHAAIAIDTTQALDDTRAALAELAEANAVIRAHAAAVQRAERAHDRLTDLVLRGGGLPELASAVAAVLDGPVTVHHPAGQPLTEVPPDGGTFATGHGEAARLTAAVDESRIAGRAVLRDGRWVCAVLAGPETLGSLVLHGRPRLDTSDRRLFERAAVVAGLLLLLRRSVAETENRIRGDLLADLLTDPARDPSGLTERGRRLGIDLDRPHLLLVAQDDPARPGRLPAAALRHLFGTEGIGTEYAGATVLLLPAPHGTDPGRTARDAAGQLALLVGAPVTVAAAGPAAGPRQLADAHAEAARCLRALHVLGRTGDGACAAELGFLGVLLGNGHDVSGFVTAALGPLLEYDARRGTELVRTLGAYFDSGGRLNRAKDELHVHVNTVVQRLDRIQALIGPDWNSPERALELHMALKLHHLASRHGG